MQRQSSVCLFGGALFLAGLTPAQVADNVSVRLIGDTGIGVYEINPDFDPYVDPYAPEIFLVEDQSFDVSGGLGSLPFSQQGIGYIPTTFSYFGSGTSVQLAVEDVSTGGALAFEVDAYASAGGRGYGYVVSDTSFTVAFDIASPWTFEYEYLGSLFDEGNGGLIIRSSSGEVLLSEFLFVDQGRLAGNFSESFDAGSYTVELGAGASDGFPFAGNIQARFSIIPAPTTAALLGFAGMLTGSRRRRSG